MTAEQETNPTRRSRGSRRRLGLPPRAWRRFASLGLSRAPRCRQHSGLASQRLCRRARLHGYEDTKVTDFVELSGISRATFYERFESKELCFAAAYEDGVERLAVAVEEAVAVSAAGLISFPRPHGSGSNSSRPTRPLAHLLFVESLAAARPARLDTSARWSAWRRFCVPPLADGEVSEETARMLRRRPRLPPSGAPRW